MNGARSGPTIGIDIGGTSVRAALVGPDHRILAVRRAPTPSSVGATEDLLARQIGELTEYGPVRAVGLAVAGFLDETRSRVRFAPHLAWRDDPVPERLTARLGIPVVMDHDVNCAALAEFRRGALAGSRVGLLVALGTGIGAGLMVNGVLYRGAHGIAPELGHLVVVPGGRPCPCGKRGCWERYCSGTALVATARELLAGGGRSLLRAGTDGAGLTGDGPTGEELTGTDVARAAEAGDELARQVLNDLGRWLGTGLAMAADVLDPELIVIGGGVAAAAAMYLPVAVAAMADQLTGAGHRPVPRVRVAAFGPDAGIIGAALLAADVDFAHERIPAKPS